MNELEFNKEKLYLKLNEIIISNNNNYNLINGFKILSNYFQIKNFYLYLLEISLDNSINNNNIKIFSSICFKNFIEKNWSVYLFEEEKDLIFKTLINNINNNLNYYFKNFITRMIGIIYSKEFNNYQKYIFDILNKLKILNNQKKINQENNENFDIILRIIWYIIYYCEDNITKFTNNIIIELFESFEKLNKNYKLREKIIKIIYFIISKITIFDGTDNEFLDNQLKKNNLFQNLLNLLIKIILFKNNYECIYNIKKLSFKIIFIIIDEMPFFCQKNNVYNLLKDKIFEFFFIFSEIYLNKQILNKQLIYSEEEKNEIQTNGFLYKNGYESENDEDEEFSDIDGIIYYLFLIMNKIFENEEIFEEINKNYNLIKFLIFCKIYIIMNYHNFQLLLNNQIDFIEYKFDDIEYEENENISIKKNIINLIKIILNNNENLNDFFIKMIFQEIFSGMNKDNYEKNINNNNLVKILFHKDFYFHVIESNLYIIGNLIENVQNLIENNLFNKNDLYNFIDKLNELIISKKINKENIIIFPSLIEILLKFYSFYNNEIFEKIFLNLCNFLIINNTFNDILIFVFLELLYVNIQNFKNKINFNSNYENIINILFNKFNEESIIFFMHGLISFLIIFDDKFNDYLLNNYFNIIFEKIFLISYKFEELFNLFKIILKNLSINQNILLFFIENKEKINENLIIQYIISINIILNSFKENKIQINNENLNKLEKIINFLISKFYQSNDIEIIQNLNDLLIIFLFFYKEKNTIIENYIFFLLNNTNNDFNLLGISQIILIYYKNNDLQIDNKLKEIILLRISNSNLEKLKFEFNSILNL